MNFARKEIRVAFFLTIAVVLFPAGVSAQQSPNIAFVSEYVRELGANERDRELNEKEVSVKDVNEKFAAMIRGTTRATLTLSAQISALQSIRLAKPYAELPNNIATFYRHKIDAYKSMTEMATAMLSGPKPGVDYGAMMADAPKLTAMVEYIDRALFEATPLVFSTLIDPKPDKDGHMSRLIVTRAERDQLVRSLEISFGKKLDQKEQNYIVSSASVLRDYLAKKGYKCADEF